MIVPKEATMPRNDKSEATRNAREHLLDLRRQFDRFGIDAAAPELMEVSPEELKIVLGSQDRWKMGPTRKPWRPRC